MREIKLRAWDKERKELVYYEPLKPYEVTDEYWVGELMQYTGLKDKNGKEVYGGDIVRFPTHIWSKDGEHSRLLVQREVKFTDGCFCADGMYSEDCFCVEWNEVEVIGNIYENKDLMK